MAVGSSIQRVSTAALACALVFSATVRLHGQSATGSYRGLAVTVSSIARATNVSLTDCPAGANSVRGVIRPGDANEFVSVTLDFKVGPQFKSGPVPSPLLHDAKGQSYKTAQAFAEIGSAPAFSCTFSYRVPKGMAAARLTIDTLSLDLSKVP
jgi:hypothetical protein